MSNRFWRLVLALLLGSTARAARAQEPLRLSFHEALMRATGTNPVMTLAALRGDEARGRLREARSPLLPTLLANGSWVNRTFNKDALGIKFPAFPGTPTGKLIGPFDVYDLRLQLNQTLLDFSSGARVRAARALVASTEADSGLAAEGAAQVTALAYLRAVRAQAVVAAREADSTLAVELVSLAQAQKDAEVGTQIDVTRAQTQRFTAAGALVVARNQLERARIDLARSLGLESNTAIVLTDTLSADLPIVSLPADRDSLVALALAHRPDLQAESARGLAARRSMSAISAERLPRVALEADYGATGLSLGSAIGTRQIVLQVSVPILDGFRREARQAQQRSAISASDVRIEELKRQVGADVDGARLDLGSARQQGLIAVEQLRLAQAELNQARERFKAGVAGNIEVIEAQSSLIRARDTDIDARFAAAAAAVALARAAGVARSLH